MRSTFPLTAAILGVGLYLLEGQTGSTPVTIADSLSIQRMDHVGINVTDLQRSADWYAKVLGFTIFHKWKTTWMMSRGDMHIGLFLRPAAKRIDDLDHALAITHFAYATDAKGFQEAQETLKKLGVPFDPPVDTGVAQSIYFSDPDGYQVEITSFY
jgi:catechol-2,3-dioxygenase